MGHIIYFILGYWSSLSSNSCLSLLIIFWHFFILLCLCSLFTLTTWSWSAGHINWSMKATSSCLMRNLSQCGRLLTTAIAVATLPPLWSSRTLIQESPSSSEQCPTLKESSHPEQPHRISCKQLQTRTVQPFFLHIYCVWQWRQHLWTHMNFV